jgi:hypothetical protein
MGHSRSLAKVLVALRLSGSYPSSVLSFVGIWELTLAIQKAYVKESVALKRSRAPIGDSEPKKTRVRHRPFAGLSLVPEVVGRVETPVAGAAWWQCGPIGDQRSRGSQAYEVLEPAETGRFESGSGVCARPLPRDQGKRDTTDTELAGCNRSLEWAPPG